MDIDRFKEMFDDFNIEHTFIPADKFNLDLRDQNEMCRLRVRDWTITFNDLGQYLGIGYKEKDWKNLYRS